MAYMGEKNRRSGKSLSKGTRVLELRNPPHPCQPRLYVLSTSFRKDNGKCKRDERRRVEYDRMEALEAGDRCAWLRAEYESIVKITGAENFFYDLPLPWRVDRLRPSSAVERGFIEKLDVAVAAYHLQSEIMY